MMAHDSATGRPQLSAESVSELTSALRRFAAGDGEVDAIQPALRAVASEAREKRVHAEQLLVLLKDIWYGLPQVRELADSDAGHSLLQRLVTVCIREYYTT